MTETFTTTSDSTINGFEMKKHENFEQMGAEEDNFYNSIRVDLDMIERAPKAATIQNILNHSKNLR